LLAVGSIAFSYYTYTQSRKEREPVLVIDKIRTLIVDSESIAGRAVRIQRADGRPIDGDVSSLTFYFWNAGALAIRESHVLSPLSLRLNSDDAEILDFRILRTSRPSVMRPSLAPVGLAELRLSFAVLDRDDGFACQILYAGDPDTEVSVTGAIEGVPRIRTNVDMHLSGAEVLFYAGQMTLKVLLMMVPVVAVGLLIIYLLLRFDDWVTETAAKHIGLGRVYGWTKDGAQVLFWVAVVSLMLSGLVVGCPGQMRSCAERSKGPVAASVPESLRP